jgi:hypothetical protein
MADSTKSGRMLIMRILSVALLAIVLSGCDRLNQQNQQKEPAPPKAPVNTKPSFVPPTAEQAYRLQDDCTRRGEAILREDEIGPVLTHEQVSRYNPTTNRCYVRLEVHAMNLNEWDKYDNSTYLEDGQTGELLAFFIVKAGGARSFLGFGCSEEPCVEEKLAACMGGKECEPN